VVGGVRVIESGVDCEDPEGVHRINLAPSVVTIQSGNPIKNVVFSKILV
jgi:hypothetical protein